MPFIRILIRYIALIMGYVLLTTTSWAINIENCLKTANQIYIDFKKYPAITEQRLNWMKLAWLKENLGFPETKQNKLQQTEYTWKCNPQNYITATLTSDASSIYLITGRVQVPASLWEFVINLDESSSYESTNNMKTITLAPKPEENPPINITPAPTETSTPAITQEKPDSETVKKASPEQIKEASKIFMDYSKGLLEKSIPEYNKKFGTNVKDVNELETSIKDKIKDFGDKYVTCTLGNYEYPSIMIGVIYLKTVIKEKEGDLCITETSYKFSNADIFMTCKVPMQELPKLKETFADVTQMSAADATKKDSQNSVVEKYCTVKATIIK